MKADNLLEILVAMLVVAVSSRILRVLLQSLLSLPGEPSALGPYRRTPEIEGRRR